MTFELMKHFQDYDKVVVLTGDGDYFWVLEYLIKHGKELQLMSFGRRTASELKELAGGSFNELTRIPSFAEFVVASINACLTVNSCAFDISILFCYFITSFLILRID